MSLFSDSCSKLQLGMPKYRRHRCLPTTPVADDAMLLGEDYHGNQQGGLHMSEEDQSDARPRHSANGRLVMDVEMKSDRASALQQVHMSCVYGSTKAIRCTVPNCSCDCFTPGKPQMRTCDTCKHGWVAHALDKLGFRHLYNCNQVEIVQPNIVFDIASLMLYGCQATPIRLKILLDRLFSVLQHEEVLQVLHGFGWGYEDYARGYILQDSQGNVLDKWTISTRDEEPFILQQFLRFGETKAITQQILLQESSERPDYVVQPARADSDIKRFIERTNRVANPFYRQGDGYLGAKPPPQPHHQPVPASKPSVRIPSAGGSSVHNLSPNGSSQSFGSPVNCTSPLSISPLNRLQSMQPYNYSRERGSPLGSSPFQLQALPPSSQPSSQPAQQAPPSQRLGLTNSGMALHLPSSCTSPTATSLPTLGSSIVHSSNSSLLANSDLSGSDGGSDEDTSCSALNLSRTATSDSIYAAKKVKHLRKSANPMKRRWNPAMLGALVSNSGSGKKRVQCSVCLKTFCDKGALKIHFSAVHLKEMHKCTVDGCNMMFSSRRSRNRHSANPNPKLHSPHLRRKISPHDGRTAHAHPTFFIGAGLPPPMGHVKLEYEHHERHGHRSLKHEHHERHGHRSLKLEHRDFRELQEQRELEQRLLERREEEQDELDNHHREMRVCSRGPIPLPPPLAEPGKAPAERIPTPMDVDRSRSPSPAARQPPTEDHDEAPIELTRPKPQDDGVEEGHFPSKEDHFLSKENNFKNEEDRLLTKEDNFQSKEDRFQNEEEHFQSKEDRFRGEEDRFQSKEERFQPKEEHFLTKEDHFLNNRGVRKRKSLNPTRCAITDDDGIQYVSSEDSSSDTFLHNDSLDNGTDKSDDFKDEDDDDEDDEDAEIKTSLTSLIAADRIKRESGLLRKEPPLSKDVKKSPEESSEAALRHLESLSQGNFGDSSHFSLRALNLQASPLPHALHLPLSSLHGLPGDGFGDTSPRLPDSTVSGPQGSSVGSNPDSPLSESQPLPGFSFRDSSLSSMDVPVDKDNPRRCTACGKIFQNHFGVKTHYQNVHLKLMHKCTVEGCNAAFPSKRSRDRHSANLNLHRKLLSTTEKSFLEKSIAFASLAGSQTLRDEFLARIYGESPILPMNLNELYQSKLSTSVAESVLNNNDRSIHNSNHFGPPHHLPLHAGLLVPTSEAHMDLSMCAAKTADPSPPPHLFNSASHNLIYSLEDDLPSPDANGNFPCKFCHKRFQDGVLLKDHYEKIHLPEMFRCTVTGCNKIFSSQKKRNQHSQNSSVHKHLAMES